MLDWLKGGQSGLYVEQSPEIIESSSNIALTCFSSQRKETVVPCRFHWYRSKNGVTTEIVNAKGSTYMCQPSDVGAIMKVDLESIDPNYPGQKTLQFGPVKMDVLLKKNIEAVLHQGHGNFNVRLQSSDGKDHQVVLTLSEAALSLLSLQGQRFLDLPYALGNPIIEVNLKDSSRVLLDLPAELHQGYSAMMFGLGLSVRASQPGRLDILFSSRLDRDTFLFSHKAFSAKKELAVAHVIHQIESNTLQQGDNFNYLLQIESLRFDLYRMIVANTKLAEERDSYHTENARLHQQLAEISSNMLMQSGHKGVSGSTLKSSPGATAMHTPGFVDHQVRHESQVQPFYTGLEYPELVHHPLSTPNPQNFTHIFTAAPAMERNHSADLAAANFITVFGNPIDNQHRSKLQEFNIVPHDDILEDQALRMASQMQPPPIAPELTLEQRQRMDIIALQDYSNKAYEQIKKLRVHIDKLSAEVAWFYTQHGQPTLPLRLRYRVSQEVNPIKEESSMFEKSKTLEMEHLKLSPTHEQASDTWKSKEIHRLTSLVNKLRDEADSLQEKNKTLGYRVSYLEDSCKKKEEESRQALNKIIELNGVIKGLEQFLSKLQSPNKVMFKYSGQTQKNVPFRAHDYTINASELIRELESLKARNMELIREKGELTKLRNMAQGDVLLAQIQKGKLEQKVKTLEAKLQEAEKELMIFMKKATSVENKLTDIISENTRLQSRRDEQLAVRSSQALHQKDQEIARIYSSLHDKEQRLQQLDLQLRTLTDENQALLKWQNKHRKRQEELQEENRMLRRGQDALSRSRQLNSQLDSFHAEQNQLLRQQYELLKEEHDKLTHMCDRYHTQAKQSLKLRQEILKLKEQQMRFREPEGPTAPSL